MFLIYYHHPTTIVKICQSSINYFANQHYPNKYSLILNRKLFLPAVMGNSYVMKIKKMINDLCS